MLATAILAAAAFADLAAIDRAVEDFIGAPPGNEGGAQAPVDRRLRLSPCPTPLVLSWRTARHDTVVVECRQGQGWRLFVPVRTVAQVASTEILIRRGDPVSLTLSGPNFSISQPAEALDPGGTGAWIRVRGLGAKAQPMRARIVRAGLVVIPIE